MSSAAGIVRQAFTPYPEDRFSDNRLKFNDRHAVSIPLKTKLSLFFTAIKCVVVEAFKHLHAAFKHAAAFLAHSVSTSENVQSICKFGKSFIPFFKYAFSAETEGFNNLSKQFAIVDSTLEVAEFVTAVKDLFVPFADKKDKSIDHPEGKKKTLLFHKDVSKWKKIGKCFGAASKVVGVFKFLLDIGILKLAQVSAYLNTIPVFKVIGEYSPLKLVKDTLTVISASFGIADHGVGIKEAQANKRLAALKARKWQVKENLLKDVSAGTLTQQRNDDLKTQYVAIKIALASLDKSVKAENKDANRKWAVTVARYNEQGRLGVHETHCKNKVGAKMDEVKKQKSALVSNWLGIAFNVAKIAAVAMGLTALFVLALSGPVFALVLGSAWLVTSSIGMCRLYYGFRQKQKEENMRDFFNKRNSVMTAYSLNKAAPAA